jgi:Lrp/AsnC family transcriptional regulator for asnA, asnC and gidA
MFVDDTDLKIIRRLWDGRTPFSEISKEIGIITNTVRNRVNRLTENGILQIIGLVNPDAIPDTYSAFIGFKIQPIKTKKALKQIGNLKGVVAAVCVSGRFDVMAVVLFNKEHSHRHFIFDELTRIEGVLSTETFFSTEAVNWQLRYVL